MRGLLALIVIAAVVAAAGFLAGHPGHVEISSRSPAGCCARRAAGGVAALSAAAGRARLP